PGGTSGGGAGAGPEATAAGPGAATAAGGGGLVAGVGGGLPGNGDTVEEAAMAASRSEAEAAKFLELPQGIDAGSISSAFGAGGLDSEGTPGLTGSVGGSREVS
ncbi:unnamed protein product, partial [Discosporangium mesarthrocarpum]